METNGMAWPPQDRVPPSARCPAAALPRMLEQMGLPRRPAGSSGIDAFGLVGSELVGRATASPADLDNFVLDFTVIPVEKTRDLPPSRARAPACHPARSAPHPTIPCRRPRPAVGARIGSYPPCLPSSWRLTLRVRRCRRFGWRLLDFGRLHTSARARCNIGVNCPQLVARRLVRLAKVGSSLSPLKAPLGALRAGSGQRGLREHYGKPCNYWPHGSASSRGAYGFAP